MNPKKIAIQKKTGAGVAGAGSGTLLIALFNTLDDSNPFKKWLILGVPSISVGSGFIFLFLFSGFKSWWKNLRVNREQKQFETLAIEILNNPNTSEKHKEETRKKLEEVQKTNIDNKARRVIAFYEENDQFDSMNTNQN